MSLRLIDDKNNVVGRVEYVQAVSNKTNNPYSCFDLIFKVPSGEFSKRVFIDSKDKVILANYIPNEEF